MTSHQKTKLKNLLADIPPESIWRSVYDAEGILLAQGKGYPRDGIHAYNNIDFKGKTVADLGSNQGHFSRFAARQGAREVWGYDEDERLTEVATLLTAQEGMKNVLFHTRDILKQRPDQVADMAMLVDVIGKGIVASGKLRDFLHALQNHGDQELILTVRPTYRIQKDLQTTAASLESMYGSGFMAADRFLVVRFILRTLAPKWRCTPLPHALGKESKIPLRFVRTMC